MLDPGTPELPHRPPCGRAPRLVSRSARHGPGDTSLASALAGATGAVLAAVPGADYAGITRVPRDAGHLRAGKHQFTRALDDLQALLNQGPCVAAQRAQRDIIVPDLSAVTQWPHFVTKALELGVRSILCLHLSAARATVGTLTLYSTDRAAFTGDDVTISRIFANQAAIALHASTRGGAD